MGFFSALAVIPLITLASPLQMNWLDALLILIFGFLFTIVSSRLTGEIGTLRYGIKPMVLVGLKASIWSIPTYLVDTGINGHYTKRPDGSEVKKYEVTKAVLMSYIIKVIFRPWSLVVFGVLVPYDLENLRADMNTFIEVAIIRLIRLRSY